MTQPTASAIGQIERTYVAYCIASEIVRIKRSADKYMRTGEQARDLSRLLMQPLEALADRLGMTTAVEALVRDALATTVPAAPPVALPSPPHPAWPATWSTLPHMNGAHNL